MIINSSSETAPEQLASVNSQLFYIPSFLGIHWNWQAGHSFSRHCDWCTISLHIAVEFAIKNSNSGRFDTQYIHILYTYYIYTDAHLFTITGFRSMFIENHDYGISPDSGYKWNLCNTMTVAVIALWINEHIFCRDIVIGRLPARDFKVNSN